MSKQSLARRIVASSELRQARCRELEDTQPTSGNLIRTWMNDPEVNVITLYRPKLRLQESAERLLANGANWTLIGSGTASEAAESIHQQALERGACPIALAEITADIRATSELYLEATGLRSAQGRLIFIPNPQSPMHLTWLHVDTHDGAYRGATRFPYRMLVSYAGHGVRWFANENVKPEYWSELVRFGPEPSHALHDPDWWYDTPNNAMAFIRSNLPGGVAHVSPPFEGPRLRFDIW